LCSEVTSCCCCWDTADASPSCIHYGGLRSLARQVTMSHCGALLV
jgi:hypothetical protein